MKKFLLVLLALGFVSGNVFAFQQYSYDPYGNRVYHGRTPGFNVYDKNGNLKTKVREFSNGRTVVYDGNGNKTRSYVPRPNGRTYVYDGDGNKVGSIRNRNVPNYNYYNRGGFGGMQYHPGLNGRTVNYGNTTVRYGKSGM